MIWLWKKIYLPDLCESLSRTSAAYDMEVSAERTKLMANNTEVIRNDIKACGRSRETGSEQLASSIWVPMWRMMGPVNPSCSPGFTQASAAFAKLQNIWNDKIFSLNSNVYVPMWNILHQDEYVPTQASPSATYPEGIPISSEATKAPPTTQSPHTAVYENNFVP